MTINEQIIAGASYFLNLHETKANAVWADPNSEIASERSKVLVKAMEDCGWKVGWAYCAGFVEAVWTSAYKAQNASQAVLDEIGRILCPSVMQSVHNLGTRIAKDPVPGSIFFLQKGKTAFGHAGIVVRADSNYLYTIEANTSPSTSTPEADREGDGIYRKTRRFVFKKTNGLWLRGFYNPPAI